MGKRSRRHRSRSRSGQSSESSVFCMASPKEPLCLLRVLPRPMLSTAPRALPTGRAPLAGPLSPTCRSGRCAPLRRLRFAGYLAPTLAPPLRALAPVRKTCFAPALDRPTHFALLGGFASCSHV